MGAEGFRFDCSLTNQIDALKNPKSKNEACGPKNILLVEGSKDDRKISCTNTSLLERVWILSRPPQNLNEYQPTVSARRVQIVRKILDGDLYDTTKCPSYPPCKEDDSTQGSSTRPPSTRSISIVSGA